MKKMRSIHVFFVSSSHIALVLLSLLLLFCNSSRIAVAQAQGSRTGAFVYTGGNGYSGSTAPVSGYAINASSGTLSLVGGSPFALPSRLVSIAGDPTGKFVYVATDDGSLSAFTVDSQTGSLTSVAGSPYTAPTGGSSYWGNGKLLAIDPAGKYLYVAGGSKLYGFSIDAGSGALTTISGSPFTLSASALTVDPSGKYLAVYNGSGVQTYAITSSSGVLTAAGVVVSGCGGSHMTFEPAGHFLYGTTGSGIAACRFDSTSGALSAVSGSPFTTGSGASFMGVAAHPSGSFLYATDSTCVNSGPQNRLYGFVIDPSTGALTAIGGSPFALPSGSGCNYDFDVAAEASGNFVYTVDANDGVAAYKANASTGALTLASGSFTGIAAYTLATVSNAMSSTATVTSVEITPATAQITTSSLGKQYQFTLKVTYSDGSTGFLTRSASWSSSDTNVATVTSGLATSTGYGTTTITASIDGQSATASLTVNPLPPTSITVTPQSITLHQGTALQLKATGKYSDGSSIDLTTSVTWTSLDPSVATVSTQGFLQAVANGSTTVTAADSDISGTVSVTVVAATTAPTRTGAFVYTGGNGYSGSTAPVSGYAINASSGTLSLVGGSPFALSGRLLAVVGDPTGKFVYGATDDGSLSAFTADSQAGSLTPVAGSPYSAPTGGYSYGASGKLLAIDPAGKYLYVAGGSKLYGFSIDATSGVLTAISGSPFTLIASALTVDPSGKYLAVYNGSAVQSYAITSSSGVLTAAGVAVSGCGGGHMTFEPAGHFLYGTTGSGIAACSFNSSSGALATVTGSPFATGSGASFMGVAAHPSGSFLYATDSTCVNSGPQNRLYGFVIDPSTGALTAIGSSPFALPSGGGCNYDFDVAAEASGNFVYTVDANDGVAAYKANASTGALTLASGSFTGIAAYTLATVSNAMSSTATVTSVEITPATAQITTSSLGKQYQFTLKATYSDGSTGFLTKSASWSSSDQTVATVTSGLATSTGYGTTTITASIDGQSATASLTAAEPALTSITVAPSTVTVYQGTAIQLTATGEYADGSSVDLTSSVAWSSSNSSAATVSATGLVQSVGIGSATISATDTVTATASVTVVAPTPVLTRTGAFVYTGNTPWGSPSNALVNGYVINATAGTLTKMRGTPFAAGGQVLAVASHPSGRFAYVATGSGTVAAFTVDSLDGSLTPVPGSPYTVGASLGSGTVLVIDPAGKFLYVAGGSSLYAFAIDSTAGGLSAAAGSPFSLNASAVTIDPSGKYLVAWSGSGASSYAINGTTGALTAASSAVTGCGSSSMTFEPSGHFLYGVSNGISACSFDGSSGALAPVTGSPLVPPGAGGFSGVAVHPSGAFLYASLNDCNDNATSSKYLYGYLIDPNSGNLTAIDGSPFALPAQGGCYYGEDVATEASGNFVYTVEANNGTAAYTVNQTTGAVTLASSSFSGPAAFTVTTVPNAMSSTATVTGLQIVPGSAQIHTSTLGKQYQFTLTATFSDGSTGFLTNSATWTSSSPSVATVAAGLATSTGYGPTTITASIGGQSATASLTVAEPALTSINVTPSTVTVYEGTAIQLTATGEYADGSSVDLTNTVAWSSSNTSAATVSTAGLVQSVELGTATISATAQTIVGATSLTVVPPFALGATGSNGTSATVSSGGAASFGLALAPAESFTGLVTFTCANLPPNSTCTVNPPSANVVNGTPVSIAVSIQTGHSSSAKVQKERVGWELALASLPLFVFVIPVKVREWARRYAAVMLLLIVGLACVSCSGGAGSASTGGTGGSGGGGTSSATPSGTYTVIVAATSAGKTPQNIQLTVTVQ